MSEEHIEPIVLISYGEFAKKITCESCQWMLELTDFFSINNNY